MASLNLPVNHVSKSQIEMYLRCPKQYEFRYILGLKEPPAVALVQGGKIHEALDMNNKHKIQSGEDLPANVVQEKFADEFETASFEIERWDEPKDAVMAQSRKLIQSYMNVEAPLINPVASEEKIENTIEYEDGLELPVVAIIDVREENAIGDYKVSSRRKSKNEMEGNLQMGLYAYLKEIRNTYFMMMLKGKDEVARQTLCVEDIQVRWTLQVMREVAQAISRGVFPPCDPGTSWCCSKAYCGYYPRCRGKQ
jgi:CRISPR/Cas system-associated exonuclease Cas4 (RecB family)